VPIKKQTSDRLGSRAGTQTVNAAAITKLVPARGKSVGRPPKLQPPDMPEMPMEEAEQKLFDYFIDAYNEQYPDLTPTDHLTLFLAGIEFIKYIRVAREELETGKVITMSRQHPGVNLRGLLDQLSVTRKARTAGKKPDDPEAAELENFLMGLSAKPKRGPS